MEFQSGHQSRETAITDLFVSAFSASEGADEGAVIGAFVRDLMETTPSDDMMVWSAYEAGSLLGCIFLTRMTYPEDERVVFILSPVAVGTEHQRRGVGQALIRAGLEDLREKGVDVVLTYGDPTYYAKVGFAQIKEDWAKAPLDLSFPEGWLGQSLSRKGNAPLRGSSLCVPALNKPELW